MSLSLPKDPDPPFKKYKKGYWIIKRRPWLRNVFILVLSLVVLTLVGIGAGYYLLLNYTGGFYSFVDPLVDDGGKKIDFTKFGSPNFKKESVVYANNGQITDRIFEEVRHPIKIEDVPELVKGAFMAAEDKRFNPDRPNKLWMDKACDPFYRGVDPCAVIRAGLGHLMRVPNTSGASGIPSQGIRLSYADKVSNFKNRDRTIKRKIKEARMAIQIYRSYPKDKILENFLNEIWFGHGVNGIDEAPRRYFNVDIRQLNGRDKTTLREIAILASLNKSAKLYCPIFHKPAEPTDLSDAVARGKYEVDLAQEQARVLRARERNNWVLGRLFEDGYISEKEHNEALFKKDEPLDLDFLSIQPLKDSEFGYSNRMVKEMLLSKGHADKELTSYGGLRIYTTIDPNIQRIAYEEFKKHLTLLNEGVDPQNRLNGAFVVMEVKTGNILALSGGNNFDESQFNRVWAYRSPGSGIKPFIYATAIENGSYDLFTKACNTPFSMRGANGKAWTPRNFEEKSPRPMDCNRDFAEGVIFSLNLETLNIARKITMEPIISLMHDLGIWGNPGIVRDSYGKIWFRRPGYQISGGLVPLLPTAIGASDVSLLELANAYTVFFRGGTYLKPTLIKEVRNGDNEIIYKSEAQTEKRVLSQETSDKVLAMMRAVTKVGTSKISMRGIEQQVACKTGTSDGPRDVSTWCGSPEIFIGIRLGHDDYSVIELPEYMKKISGDSKMLVSGGWVVAFLERLIFDRIYAARQKIDFSPQVEESTQLLTSRYQK